MGNYSVPENIRKLKPKGTMVKLIKSKYYYVYEQTHVKVNDKWKIKMGKMVGIIKEDIGFIPNDNYNDKTELTTLDFGEYFVSVKLTESILEKLKATFNIEDAYKIYFISLIHFINGFTYIKYFKDFFSLSYLSIKYPSISLSEYNVSSILDSLGRRQNNIEKFESQLISESSNELAIDGHCICSPSLNNCLSEDGNKKNIFKDKQINLLMAYDINTNIPLLSRMYDGSALDKITVQDILARKEFINTLFIVDRGFYSKENLKYFSKNGNKYIIPLYSTLKNYKRITSNIKCENNFIYENGNKKTVIEYCYFEENGAKVIFYRDLSQNIIEAKEYFDKIGIDENYTLEEYNIIKNLFCSIVLESNLDKTPEEIYRYYKKRWRIETFYDYIKNKFDVNALHQQDYYQIQGLSFILLITSLIHHEFVSKSQCIKKNITEIMMASRFLKIHKKCDKWMIENTSKKHYELLNQLKVNYEEELAVLNRKL